MKKADIDDLADISEPGIDELSKELLGRFLGDSSLELAQSIPFAKTVVIVGKLFNSAKEYRRTKMLISFLSALENGTKTMDEFDRLTVDQQNDIRGLVIAQLDLHSDVRQAEALGLIVDAYLRKKIDRLTFTGIVGEIKNTNPLLYYFNVDSIEHTVEKSGAVVATGPTYLLPSAFGHNTVRGIGQWSSTGEYYYVVSRLGQSFLENVYDPMALKYMI